MQKHRGHGRNFTSRTETNTKRKPYTNNLVGEGSWLRSILDVLVLFDDKAIVMDWKTGKRRPDFSQLEMFALQVFQHYPSIKKVQSTFVWLKDMSLDSHTYSRVDTDDMWVKLLSKTERINQSFANNNWPPKPSGLCRFCPAKNICEYST